MLPQFGRVEKIILVRASAYFEVSLLKTEYFDNVFQLYKIGSS